MSFLDMPYAEPRWLTCACGELSAAKVCPKCERLAEALHEARTALMATVPSDYRALRFGRPELAERIKVTPAIAIAQGKVAVNARRVVLRGAAGAGKTSLAVAMARAWVETNRQPAVFAVCPTLATCRMRTSFGREAPEVLEALTVPLLVLDDLGTPEREPATSPLTEIIFQRTANSRPTWVTTWMSLDDCTARYGDGVARRLFEEDSGARVIELGAVPASRPGVALVGR